MLRHYITTFTELSYVDGTRCIKELSLLDEENAMYHDLEAMASIESYPSVHQVMVF